MSSVFTIETIQAYCIDTQPCFLPTFIFPSVHTLLQLVTIMNIVLIDLSSNHRWNGREKELVVDLCPISPPFQFTGFRWFVES
jgi:hypothetical protein